MYDAFSVLREKLDGGVDDAAWPWAMTRELC